MSTVRLALRQDLILKTPREGGSKRRMGKHYEGSDILF